LSAERNALTALAESIADGAPVNWEHAERAAPPEQARLVRHLRLVSSVADLYRSLPAEPAAGIAGPTGEPRGPRWGHLEIIELIGRGTSGEVHRAWDLELHREVALKLFPPDPAMPPHTYSDVLSEARRLARVRHRNVATVYGADRDQHRVGFWMELVHGASLQDVLDRDGAFGARETALIGIELCGALAAVHAAGLLHRDVKAQNVLRETGGRIVLTDFGTGEDAGTKLRRMAGTPVYLAPEILAGKPATAQTDLYSLGVLLFHMVTREFPIKAGTMQELMRAHKSGSLRHLRDLRPDLPAAFVEVVERLLAPNPAGRFQTAGAVEAALRGALAGSATAATDSPENRPGRPRASGWTRAVATAAGFLLVATVALIAWSVRATPSFSPAEVRTIAVAPMTVIGPTSAPPFFAEGLTDQLVSTLGQIKSLQIKSSAPGDRSVGRLSRQDVDAILETTLVTEGDSGGSSARVRINARLVAAGSRTVIWTGTFERALGDTFGLQAAIARDIAAAVSAETTAEEASRLTTPRQTTEQASAAFIEGIAHLEKYGTEDWLQARGAFERAIAADPEYAPAHAGLARALFTLGHADAIPQPAARVLAQSHARTALGLDDTLPEAHATLADIAFYYDWDWQAAEMGYLRSIDLNASFSYGRTQYAQLLAAAGRTTESVAQATIAADLQPTSARVRRQLGLMRYYHGDFTGADAAIRESLRFDRHAPGAWIIAGRIAEAAGRLDEAREHTDWGVRLSAGVPGLLTVQQLRLTALSGQPAEAKALLDGLRRGFDARGIPWNPQFDAYVYLAAGEHERALDFFEIALGQRHWSLLWLAVDPRLDPVREHPRFVAILRELGVS
jgi:eukaryotic-like serine/threonine-protein kinase